MFTCEKIPNSSLCRISCELILSDNECDVLREIQKVESLAYNRPIKLETIIGSCFLYGLEELLLISAGGVEHGEK